MSLSKKQKAKLELGYDKYSPILIALIIATNNILHFFGKDIGNLIFLFIPSILTISHMYISRSNFKLCKFHRIFVDYVTLNAIEYIFEDIINLNNYIWGILDLVTLIIFSIFAIYYYNTEYKIQHCYDADSKTIIAKNYRTNRCRYN